MKTRAGAGDEILDSAGHEHLSRLRLRGDPRSRVHGDPGNLAVDELTLASVEAGAYLDTNPRDRVNDRAGAAGLAPGHRTRQGNRPRQCRPLCPGSE